MSTLRSPVFHCPFCGEEDLVPAERYADDTVGGWHCRSCDRLFSVTLHDVNHSRTSGGPR
ncbi:hypothetical protein DT076_04680 [Desertihabitans brevis]|uniref:Insertion element protein n=1 Tax=Desertihabitans brevis TaxID=2268447 RepID=A0A367YXS0_9ACTN|nr:hypothetical protein [Desertihabitans brevis]RCK70705.1 hypothetical protein DT076_04680 [Desertihabitans brevis]